LRDRLPLAFILITVMIDAMGTGLILPVMPDLIREIGGGTLAQAAVWGGILPFSFAVMQFLFGPVSGTLSDRLPSSLRKIPRPGNPPLAPPGFACIVAPIDRPNPKGCR